MHVALCAMHRKALDDRALLSSLNAVDHVQGGAVQGSFSGLCLLSLWPPLQCLVAVALCQSPMAILSHAQSLPPGCRLTEDPAQPAAGKDLPISAYVLQGLSPLDAVNLEYTIGFAAPTTVNMTAGSGGPSKVVTSSIGCCVSNGLNCMMSAAGGTPMCLPAQTLAATSSR